MALDDLLWLSLAVLFAVGQGWAVASWFGRMTPKALEVADRFRRLLTRRRHREAVLEPYSAGPGWPRPCPYCGRLFWSAMSADQHTFQPGECDGSS